jgi:hypothetical protein
VADAGSLGGHRSDHDAGMSLQGTFDVLTFPEVLELLEKKRQTGRLHLRSGGLAGYVYVRGGELTGAELGDQTPKTSAEAKARLEELCFEFLQCERGMFDFQPRVATPWPSTPESVQEALAQARQRLQEWREIQVAIPSMEARPRVVEELAPEQVTLTRDRWRLMAAIDGRRTVHRLARTLGLGTFEVGRLLKSLVDDGIVTIDTERPKAAIAADAESRVVRVGPVDRDDVAVDAGEGREAVDAGSEGSADASAAGAAVEDPATDERALRPLLRIGTRLGRHSGGGPKRAD